MSSIIFCRTTTQTTTSLLRLTAACSSRSYLFHSYRHCQPSNVVAAAAISSSNHGGAAAIMPITTAFSCRPFSSNSAQGGGEKKSFVESLNPVSWWRDREKKLDQDKFIQRANDMASKESWTLEDMLVELEDSLGNWKATVSKWTGGAKDIESAQAMVKHIKGLVSEVGLQATDTDLENMTKIQKLRAANHAEVAVEDINLVIQQFINACAMQKVFRKRKLEGRPIPTTPERAQFVVQKEAHSLLSQKQKNRLKKMAVKALKPTFGGGSKG